EHPAEVGDRLVVGAPVEVGVAAVVPGAGEGGVQADRLGEVLDGAVKVAQVGPGVAAVVVGGRVGGVAGQRRGEVGDRLVVAAGQWTRPRLTRARTLPGSRRSAAA